MSSTLSASTKSHSASTGTGTGNGSSSAQHAVPRNHSSVENGYFSSSPLGSPLNDSPPPPSTGVDHQRPISLGVYFSADEGETNDVLAAMRASVRVVRETGEMLSVCLTSLLIGQDNAHAHWHAGTAT